MKKEDCELNVPSLVIHSAKNFGMPIVTGCPFPADIVPGENCSAEIVFPDGNVLPAQTKELISKTVGGIKWLELSFLSKFSGRAQVKLFPAKTNVKSLVSMSEEGLLLENSLMKLILNTDIKKAPVMISWKGGAGSFVPEVTIDNCKSKESLNGKRSVRILRNGDIRCRAEISGQFFRENGKPSLNYRLTVELWKDKPALRIDWMLSHEIPGVSELNVTNAVLNGEWSLGSEEARVFIQLKHTAEQQPRIIKNHEPVTIIADDTGASTHVSDENMLLDTCSYPFYCKPDVANTPPWLQLHGKTGALCMTIKDFVETAPNAIESSKNSLSYQMLPTGHTLNWPQGRRKEQNILLSFASEGEDVDVNSLAQLAEGMFASGCAMPAPETLAELKCFDMDRILPFIPGQNIRMNNLLDSYCILNTPFGKWDLGDTPDWHYTVGSASGNNHYLPLKGTVPLPKRFAAIGGLFPEASMYFVEPLWTNNEYDMIHALALEVMRTGRMDHFKTLRWAVRHNVEVDFVVYSDDSRHHRASPFHSHFHNTKGAITSHFWTQGLLEYYCLTGDDDASEVALALGDKIIEIDHSGVSANWKFDREIGWALLALVSLLDLGFDQFSEEADSIVNFLQNYDRKAFSGAVKLSAGREGRSLVRQMIDCGFGYTSMVEALDKYQRLTGRQDTNTWLNKLLEELKDEFWNKVNDGEIPTVHNMLGMIMEIGYERIGDQDFILGGELLLENYFDPAFPMKHPRGGENGQAKPCAMSYRCLHRLLRTLEKDGRLKNFEYPSVLKHKAV